MKKELYNVEFRDSNLPWFYRSLGPPDSEIGGSQPLGLTSAFEPVDHDSHRWRCQGSD